MSAPPYAIGSDHMPGLSKLIEELGEVGQVAGKIIGLGGLGAHWDGTVLKDRLEDELADLMAAVAYVGEHNGLDLERVKERSTYKRALFEKWHVEHQPKAKAKAKAKGEGVKPGCEASDSDVPCRGCTCWRFTRAMCG